jgi:FKBP-type peptidyl-prolyl cis-trans isomerase FkpA
MKALKLNKLQIFYTVILSFIVCSCGNNAIEPNKAKEDKTGETFVRVNKLMIKNDVELIKAYTKRHNWNLTETESGLWFEIFQKGQTKKVQKGDKVTFNYSLELLDGTLCYSSDSSGVKQVTAGAGNIENGLDEGLQLMNEGDKARFILPPHLAYGLSGDQKCIPPRSVVVYIVEVLKVVDKNKISNK